MIPHKHKDIIIAFANGEQIQSKGITDGLWRDTNDLIWLDHVKYRVKPDPFTQSLIDAYKRGDKIKYRLNVKYASKWSDLDFVNPEDIETYNFDQLTYKWSIEPTAVRYQKVKKHWENGGQVQYYNVTMEKWFDYAYSVYDESRVPNGLEPNWNRTEWRIKPSTPKEYNFDDPTNNINEILDNFNFEKVKKVMDFLNWEWVGSNGVPEIYELRQHARKLMNTAVTECIKSKQEDYFTECGGFRVECNKYEDDPKMYIRLSFNIESWDNWG
nr:MAG: hypothetical protein [Caudoviricetes sp.]